MRLVNETFADIVIPLKIKVMVDYDSKIVPSEVTLTATQCDHCKRVFAVDEEYLEEEIGICECPMCGATQTVDAPEENGAKALIMGG